jgi:type IV secretion system protein VirB1
MSALAAATVLTLTAQPECGGRYNIPGDRIVAVATIESSRDPLAIGVNGDRPVTLHPPTIEAAVAMARTLLAQRRSIDLGLMQINSANLAQHGLTIETAFDACHSLRAGAAHLAADFEAAWRAAHSRYNTGDLQRGISNGYAAKIERALSASASSSVSPARHPGAAPETDSWDVWAAPVPSRAPARGEPSPTGASEAAPAGGTTDQPRLVVERR